MAYDHDGDLPENYDALAVASQLRSPKLCNVMHGMAERRDLLNFLGHRSILEQCGQVYDAKSLGLIGFGATVYEIVTMPALIGNNTADSPTYRDPIGMKAAFKAAHALTLYDEFELLDLADQAAKVLDEDAPMVSWLVAEASESILTVPAQSEQQRLKVGAALMRTLHITGSALLDEPL